jgi:CheY-like chemotaxis protein
MAGRFTRKTITTFLLVEQSLDEIVLIEHAFAEAPANIELKVVRDGLDAVRYLEGEDEFVDRERFPMPAAILLDLQIAHFSGFQFLEWLRKKSPQICRLLPAIALSPTNLEEDIQHSYALGANAVMVKPFNWLTFKEQMNALGIFWTQHAQLAHVQ